MYRRTRHVAALAVALLLTSCSGETTGSVGPGEPARAAAVSGDAQTATVGAKLPAILVVKVTDAGGKAVPGVPVTWAVLIGGGTLSDAFTATDAFGQASAEWTLGTRPGEQRVSVKAGSLAPVEFTATGHTGPVTKIVKLNGDAQTDTAGFPLARSLSVRVTDLLDNPVAGVQVVWSVAVGGGAVTPMTSTTGGTGQATTSLTLGQTAGPNEVVATIAGGSVSFSATGVPGEVSAVAIAPTAATVGVGATRALAATPGDRYGNAVPGRAVAWSSADPAIASVSATGVVTGVAPGTVQIRATADGVSGSATITVPR